MSVAKRSWYVASGTIRQAIPHVTISLISDGSPVYSTELLARGVRPIAPLALSGVVEAH
jgi:hypothetical protein